MFTCCCWCSKLLTMDCCRRLDLTQNFLKKFLKWLNVKKYWYAPHFLPMANGQTNFVITHSITKILFCSPSRYLLLILRLQVTYLQKEMSGHTPNPCSIEPWYLPKCDCLLLRNLIKLKSNPIGYRTRQLIIKMIKEVSIVQKAFLLQRCTDDRATVGFVAEFDVAVVVVERRHDALKVVRIWPRRRLLFNVKRHHFRTTKIDRIILAWKIHYFSWSILKRFNPL